MNYCTKCGHIINKDDKFCVGCGVSLIKNKNEYCIKCGNKLNPRNGVCMHCVIENKKKQKQKEENNVNREIKKLDLLIKLGIVMVLIAGFVLATTTFEHIPNFVIFILFLCLSGIFYGLYKFSEKKLKIRSSTVLYFVTSLIFILIAFISAFYLGIFSKWLSFHGGGKILTISILFFLTGGLFLICKRKYNNKLFLIVSLLSFIFAILFLLDFIGLGLITNLAVLSLVLLILYLCFKNNITVVIISLVKILFDGLLVLIIRPEYLIISGTIITVCDGFLLYMFGYNEKNKLIQIFSSIVLFLFFNFFLQYALASSMFMVSFLCGVLFLLLIMIVIINIINDNNDKTNFFCRTSRIMCLSLIFLWIVLLVMQYLVGNLSNVYFDINKYRLNLFISSFILLLSNVLINKDYTLVKKNIFSYFIVPEMIISLYALVMLISCYINDVTSLTFFALLTILLFICYRLFKNKIMKNILYIASYVILVISFLNLCETNYVIFESVLGITCLLIPVISLFFYLFERKNQNRKVYKYLSIIVYSLSIIVLSIMDIFSFGSVLSTLIGFIILLLTLLINIDDNICVYVISIASFLALSEVLDLEIINNDFSIIISNAYLLLMAFLFTSRLSSKVYNFLTILFVSLILFVALVHIDNIVALYLAIISILLIIIDVLSKKIKGLYIVGIVYFVLTIIYEINNYFRDIPFWVYMLVGGLAIIMFASFKLSKKIKND